MNWSNAMAPQLNIQVKFNWDCILQVFRMSLISVNALNGSPDLKYPIMEMLLSRATALHTSEWTYSYTDSADYVTLQWAYYYGLSPVIYYIVI